MMRRGFVFRVQPSRAQERRLIGWIGATRFVYNLAFEQRRDFWRQHLRATGRRINWASQSLEVSQLRTEHDWIADVPRVCLEQALRDLDKAYGAFFSGRSKYPSPRKRGVNDAIRFQAKDVSVIRLNAKWAAVRLPKIGLVKFRATREMLGDLLNVTVSLKGGAWFVSFAREIEATALAPSAGAVGIDRGIAQTLTLSTGEHVQAPDVSALNKRIARARRILSRRKRSSGRYAAQRAKLTALTSRAARIRRDWSHRASTDVARRFGLVAIEGLNIKSMTASAAGTLAEPGRNVPQKRGLNRSILEQSWGMFATMLDYKLAERGGILVTVPAAYTSQTCAACGVIDARSRKSQAVFECVACGHADNADVNAAKEILRRSTALMDVEGLHQRPREASIMAAA